MKGCCACAWSLVSHRGTVGHLAGLDSLRQLPGDAVRRAAPGGDGPGRTLALALIDRRGLVALVALACYD